MRQWLRKLIGWDEVGAALKAMREHIRNLEALIEAQGKEIAELKAFRKKREIKRHELPSDWDQVQQMYGSNPENYKENA